MAPTKSASKAPAKRTSARKPSPAATNTSRRASAKVTDISSRRASSARPRGRGSEATRDAIMQAAEDAKNDKRRTSIQSETTGVRIATVGAVKEFAQELPDNFLSCRDTGHNWRLADQRREGRGFSRRKYCPSCKYDIFQLFDSRGMLVQEKPRYPKGYLASGMGRVNSDGKGQMRVESFERAISKAEKKAKVG